MSALSAHIESFINGNVKEAKAALKNRSHKELREGYAETIGDGANKAVAFADYIKGSISWQEYCDSEGGEVSR